MTLMESIGVLGFTVLLHVALSLRVAVLYRRMEKQHELLLALAGQSKNHSHAIEGLGEVVFAPPHWTRPPTEKARPS